MKVCWLRCHAADTLMTAVSRHTPAAIVTRRCRLPQMLLHEHRCLRHIRHYYAG